MTTETLTPYTRPRVSSAGPPDMPPLMAPGVVDALLDAVLDQAIRDTLGDGQAEVQRKTDRPGAFALFGNLAAKLQGRQFEVVGRNDGEVVAYVDGEDVQGPHAPVARQVFEPVLLRVQHGLRHDVIVRHDPAPVVDGETAPVECARFGLVEETANLHHGIARRVEPDLRIARELLARDVGFDRGSVDRVGIDRVGVRHLLFGRRTGRHLGGSLGRRLGGRRDRFLGGLLRGSREGPLPVQWRQTRIRTATGRR